MVSLQSLARRHQAPPVDALSHEQQPKSPRLPSSPLTSTRPAPKPARPMPGSFAAAIKDWRDVDERSAEESEIRLLKRLPYFRLPGEPDPEFPSLVARQIQFPLENGLHLNGLEIKQVAPPRPSASAAGPDGPAPAAEVEGEASIFAHGYGLALGFFYQNWDEFGKMAAATGRRAYFIDWMGMGRSSRPSPKLFLRARPKGMTEADHVKMAEDFFLDPLLAFVRGMKITKLSLVAHSLGGYLAGSFALRYPELVDQVILLSPAGIPAEPVDTPSASTTATTPSSPRKKQQPKRRSPRISISAPGSRRTSLFSKGRSSTDQQETQAAGQVRETLELAGAGLDLPGGPAQDKRESGSDTSLASSGSSSDGIATPPGEIESGAGAVAPRRSSHPIMEPRVATDAWNDLGALEVDDSDEDGERQVQTFRGPMGKSGKLMKRLYAHMWESGHSPLSVIRKLGPWGILLVGKYSAQRFGALPDETDRHDLADYLAQMICLPGSGEYSVGILLRPGAFARLPLVERFPELPKEVGVTLVYGDKDWMDKDAGKDAVKRMRRAGRLNNSVHICPEAGHHLYMDNSKFTNDLLWRKLAPNVIRDQDGTSLPTSTSTSVVSSTVKAEPRSLRPVRSTLSEETTDCLNQEQMDAIQGADNLERIVLTQSIPSS